MNPGAENGAEKRLSRRKFVKRTALGGLALTGGGLVYSLFRKAPGPSYPATYSTRVKPLPTFTGNRPNIIIINADDLVRRPVLLRLSGDRNPEYRRTCPGGYPLHRFSHLRRGLHPLSCGTAYGQVSRPHDAG
jgi:hypothetical protein